MGTKWDEIEALLQEAFDKDAWIHLAMALKKTLDIVRRLDEKCGGCDRKAEWILRSHSDFITYSCTAHLSLMAGTETRTIEAATTATTAYDCCYVE